MAAGAGGAGELLFPPRVGSLYGYALLWAIVAAVTLKWFINREIGRFAGLAGATETALILLLPGDARFWMIMTVLSTMAFLVWGHYKRLERAATVLAILLAVVAIVTAISVFPNLSTVAAGLVPQIPADVQYREIVPWLSYVLAGAAGMTWYSYWGIEKGYGAANQSHHLGEIINPKEFNRDERQRLRGWLSEMTLDVTIGVMSGLLIVLAFLILGTELLRPEGLLPEENQVAAVLGQLLGQVWGPIGYWFMIIAVLMGFWQTTLTNQDGWGRLFADGTNIVLQPLNLPQRWTNERFLRRAFIVVLLTILPGILYQWHFRSFG